MARAVDPPDSATQRPSVDAITVWRPTCPRARSACREDHSRTISDGNGANSRSGRLHAKSASRGRRASSAPHGPTFEESARLASFLRKQGKPTYDESITEEDKKAAAEMEFEKDDLYEEAARIVVSSGQASVSYLQRRLRIGFSRAARLVDMTEAEGLVSGISGAAGGKSREVLVKPDYFERSGRATEVAL
jgi:S-DNA-T family DNA segregation ATPase FtsK/SpoIIIE